MILTENNTDKKMRLIRSAADPVLLYTVVVMMSIMYHYRSQLAVVYGICTLIVGWLVFRLFDFAQKKKLLGALGIGVVYLLFLLMSGAAIEKGYESYPISWGVWFLTPQETINFGVGLGYNKWYTLAIYLLFLIFMLSVIYYFTQVRYRIFMNFMIFIIPFAIYGKEYEKMPIGYIMLLAVGYILLMIYFRRLHNNDKTVVVHQGEAWKSVAVYAVLFAVISTLFPKPTVQEDRTYLETLINAEDLVKRLENIMDAFRDTADGSQFREQTGNILIYNGDANEALRLKLNTFSTYNFSEDSWSVSNFYDKDPAASNIGEDMPYRIGGNGRAAEAVIAAAEYDSDFAAEYSLDSLIGKKFNYPELDVFTVHGFTRNGFGIPVPQLADSFSEGTDVSSVSSTFSGLLRGTKQIVNETYKFTYLPERFFGDVDNLELINAFSRDDYADMLFDASQAIDDYRFLHENELDQESAEYLDELSDVAYSEYVDYKSGTLREFGGDSEIRDLAVSVTAGAGNDYEKAKALEMYFYRANYIYDLDYRKQPGENVDDFLFTSKTGVCVEYATAMTLMARSVGIPARYCEGFNMDQLNQDRNSKYRFVVTSKDAHAFPELYIRGFGWMSFEPTRSDQLSKPSKVSTTNMLSRLGVILLISAVLALVLIFISPVIIHKLFIRSAHRHAPDRAVRDIMIRICRLYDIGNVNTSRQAECFVRNTSGADISGIALAFDRSVYGSSVLSDKDKEQAINEYIAAYDALREAKKKSRKRAR